MMRFAHILALVALLAISLVPSGYMVAAAEDGTLTVRMCGAGESNRVQVSPAHPDYEIYRLLHGDQDDAQGERAGEPCDMGPSSLGNLDTPPEFVVPAIDSAATHTINRPILSGIFPAALPPSTGPPLS